MSNQGVDYVIEKKKTNHVIVVLSNKVEADNELEVVLYYSTMTWLYIFDLEDSTTIEVGRYDRYWYSASIAVTITRADRCIARRSLPTVTQGVMAGLREEEEESRDSLKEAIKEELEAGEVFVLRRYFSRYFKVPTCSTLTYLYKIGDLEEDLYVPYPA
ncbi:hypothetical protein L249_7080, partial [Ophiocordyceps polyrhachis-furcata BCC 54312]